MSDVEVKCVRCGRVLVQDPAVYCNYCGSMVVELQVKENVNLRRRKKK